MNELQSPGAPLRVLRGFTRIHLSSGATQHLSFTSQPRDLSYVNEQGDRIVASGTYGVSVGGRLPGTAPAAEAPLSFRGQQELTE